MQYNGVMKEKGGRFQGQEHPAQYPWLIFLACAGKVAGGRSLVRLVYYDQGFGRAVDPSITMGNTRIEIEAVALF